MPGLGGGRRQPIRDCEASGTSGNLRTYFEKIVFRAGLQQWPRLFHNLRGSRSNDVFSQHPDHVAEVWMGQTKEIARKHYLHVTDADYETALQMNGDHGNVGCNQKLQQTDLVVKTPVIQTRIGARGV